MEKKLSALLLPNEAIVQILQRMAVLCASCTLAIAVVCLSSWVLKALSISIPLNVTGMNPLAVLGYIASAIVVYLQLAISFGGKTRFYNGGIILLSCFTIFLGTTTMITYLTGISLGVDTLLFRDYLSGNRISPNTGVSFLLLGMATLIFQYTNNKRLIRLAQVFVLLAAVISMFAIIGYVYNIFSFYEFIPAAPMPISSAVSSTLLCLALLFAKSNRGFIKVLTRKTPSSVLAFRLIIITLTLPALLGYVSLLGVRFSLYDLQTGLVLLVIGNIIFITTIIWLNSASVQRIELENLIIKNELEKKNVKLEIDTKELATKLIALEEKNQEVSEKLEYKQKLFEVVEKQD